MKVKKRKRIRYLDDIKKWRIEMLAKFGGFSRRFIVPKSSEHRFMPSLMAKSQALADI
jgi:hypothetical protein